MQVPSNQSLAHSSSADRDQENNDQVQYTIHKITVNWKQYTVYTAMYIAHGTQYALHSKLYTVQNKQ